MEIQQWSEPTKLWSEPLRTHRQCVANSQVHSTYKAQKLSVQTAYICAVQNTAAILIL